MSWESVEETVKILRVVADLYPSVVGGLGLHAHEMSKMQSGLGHRVTIYSALWHDELPEEQCEGYNIVRFRGTVILRNNLSLQLLHRLLVDRYDYDIIHAHSHLFFSTMMCSFVRKLGSPPLIVTNHGMISKSVPFWLHKAYMALFGKWIYRTADMTICYTETEKDDLIKLGIPSEKIVTIHNGVDIERFSPIIGTTRKKQILWVGRFAPEKGINYLLEGFRLFSKEFPDYTLLMIGDGPMKDETTRRITELGLSNKVILKEYIENGELPATYNESYAFILPSLVEGVPRTIIEAMSCGIPVICTNLPQLTDIVQGCGFLIPPEDPNAIQRALSDLVNNKTLADECGRKGRIRAVSSYSWNDTVMRTLELYSSLK